MTFRLLQIACLIFASVTHSFAATDTSEEECSLEKVNLDIIFLIDGSYSIEPKDFKQGLTFVSNFIDFLRDQGIDIEDETARIGVIEYSTKVTVSIPLGQITSPPLLKGKVLAVHQSEGQTYTGDGLKVMQQMFQENPRNGSLLQLGFVLTDGNCSRESHSLFQEKAAELLAANVTMYALGVGKKISIHELNIIAGVDEKNNNNNNNTETRVFQVNDYGSLKDISSNLFKTVCVAIQSQWENIFVKPEVLVPLGGIIVIILVVIVVVIVLWRLAIIARRKLILNQLADAKEELSKSQIEINRLYLNPRTTVNMSDLARASADGASVTGSVDGEGTKA